MEGVANEGWLRQMSKFQCAMTNLENLRGKKAKVVAGGNLGDDELSCGGRNLGMAGGVAVCAMHRKPKYVII